MKKKILIIDDDPSICFGFSRYFTQVGYETNKSFSLQEARELIQGKDFNAVLLDLSLPDGNGLELIDELREKNPEIAIIVITGVGDIPTAVDAMRRGADNFLTKPVNMEELEVFLEKSLEVRQLRQNLISQERLKKTDDIFLGKSDLFRKTINLIKLASNSDTIVLLQGETGTGKGVLAKYIHKLSPRNKEQFVEINCSSLRGELLISELFGHVKGAFTSASSDKQGLIEIANNGTLFLDEIAEMDLSIQSQLLKVIEEKTYRRLGDTKIKKSNFRLICATNKDLSIAVNEGRFRKDLFYRINIFTIYIPPLREMKDDIPDFANYFLKRISNNYYDNMPAQIIESLKQYQWPGNIRELKNVIERAIILAQGKPLSLEHFYFIDDSCKPKKREEVVSSSQKLKEWEAEHIISVLKFYNNDKIKAASALGISRATLYRKLKEINYLKLLKT